MVQRTRIHSSKFLLFLLLILSSISISAEKAIWRQLKETGDKYEKLSDEQKAQYGLILFKNLEASTSTDFPTEYIDFSINYYKRQADKTNLAYAYNYKSGMYDKLRQYPESTQCLLYALDYIAEISDQRLIGILYFKLARLAGYQDEFQDALNYLDQSAHYFLAVENFNLLSKVYTLRSWIYSAMHEFEKAIEASVKSMSYTTDSIVKGDALNDIGSNYYQLNQIDSALYYTKMSLEYPAVEGNHSMRYCHLSDAYLLNNELDSARKYALVAISLPIDIHIEDECYRILIDIATQLGDDDNLRHYISHKQQCTDSIMKLKGQVRVSSVKQMHEAHSENLKLKKSNTQILIVVCITLLILIGVIGFIYKYYNKKHIHKVSYYKSNIKTKEVMLSNLSEVLEQKQNILLDQLFDELKTTRKKYTPNGKILTSKDRDERERKIYNEVLYLNQEDAFINKMNGILNNLPIKLKNKYPTINYKEIMWCCLFMLNIPTKEIAILLQYTQSSLYKFKQRLSQKLNLNGTKELEELLKELVYSNEE